MAGTVAVRRGSVLVAVALAGLACAGAPSQAEVAAPDFALVDDTDRLVRLGDFRGAKKVVLVFYFGHG